MFAVAWLVAGKMWGHPGDASLIKWTMEGKTTKCHATVNTSRSNAHMEMHLEALVKRIKIEYD